MEGNEGRGWQTVTQHVQGPPKADIDSLLDDVRRRLVEAAHPDKIILFGSYARGDFHEQSDLDLLVILPAVQSRFDEMIRLRSVLRDIPMAIDVVVYSVDRVNERQHLRGTMLYHALREGRVLYDAA
jgi:predicted nucleotidyltransferase